MSLILNIDTAMEAASISLSTDGELIDAITNTVQKDHGSFLQPAIQTLLHNNLLTIDQLDAIALSIGPGSYTGLRVGMASAKGLCYALKKPLITIGTLNIMALSAILECNNDLLPTSLLFCPMIDARRMEVFTALYNSSMECLLNPCAMLLDQTSFANWLLKNKIVFFGNGAKKWEHIPTHENAIFSTSVTNPLAMSKLAHINYNLKIFDHLAYSEPLYIKEFFDAATKTL